MGRLSAAMLLVLAMAGTALAGDVVRFAFESYPPYEFVEGGAVKGVDTDMIKAVCEKIGVTPKFEEMPWKRAISEVKDGTIDAIFSLYSNDERRQFLDFPETGLSYEKNILVTKRGSALKINKLEDLKGQTVGIVREYSYGDAFDNDKDFTRDESADTEMLLKKLDNDRIPVIVINELVYNNLSKKFGLAEKLEVQPFVVCDEPMYVAFSKARPEIAGKLTEVFSKTLAEMKKSGEQQKILLAYQ